MSDENSDSLLVQVVVDASVWIGYLLSSDVHHVPCVTWLDECLLAGTRITVPTIALPEVAGAIARRTGLESTGFAAIAWIEGLPRVDTIELDDGLARASARLAASLRLRGADAVYVALAARLGLPLVTWDQELLERAAGRIEARVPGDE